MKEDSGITAFFAQKRARWIKQHTNKGDTEDEVSALEKRAAIECSLSTELCRYLSLSEQVRFATHLAKFTHSYADSSQVFFVGKNSNDGFLRSGNIAYDYDAKCASSGLVAFNFAHIKMERDGRTIIDHLEENTEYIRQQLSNHGPAYDRLRTTLLSMRKEEGVCRTHARIKQVYMPTCLENNEYHLLSILTSPGLMYALTSKIRDALFSDAAKLSQKAKKDSAPSETGHMNFRDMTVIGYGGSNPQNLGALNSKFGGKAFLLSALPPKIKKREFRRPRTDFFNDCLYEGWYSKHFDDLQSLAMSTRNNKDIRLAREKIIERLSLDIFLKVRELRSRSKEWSNEELPKHQQLWLDPSPNTDDEHKLYREEVAEEAAKWMFSAYIKQHKVKSAAIGDDELHHFKSVFIECEKVCL